MCFTHRDLLFSRTPAIPPNLQPHCCCIFCPARGLHLGHGQQCPPPPLEPGQRHTWREREYRWIDKSIPVCVSIMYYDTFPRLLSFPYLILLSFTPVVDPLCSKRIPSLQESLIWGLTPKCQSILFFYHSFFQHTSI